MTVNTIGNLKADSKNNFQNLKWRYDGQFEEFCIVGNNP